MKRLATLLMIAAPFAAAAQTQGVSKDEIVVGTIQDLSGPLAALGKQSRNGMQLAVDEINEQGGINGRKLKLYVEDSGYDPKKGVLAAQKLVQRDKVFAAVSNLGSPVMLATMPLFLERKVLHLFPAAAHPSAYEPLHKYKFQNLPSYAIQIEKAAPSLIKQHGYKKVGILYQDDDFGHDVLAGAETALKGLKMPLCGKATYKRGATDFSSQVATLKGSGCDFVILGTVLRETVGVMAEARKSGWEVPMLVQAAGYSAQVPALGGKATEGLYGTPLTPHPYPDASSPKLMAWIAAYKQRFNADPNAYTAIGYAQADLFVLAARKAGPNLTADSFSEALETLVREPDFLGSPRFRFSKADHLGSRATRLAQIRNGRWENISDYME
jgi:ABC-type branched-subunit amino acid transport system substrate-binding protein